MTPAPSQPLSVGNGRSTGPGFAAVCGRGRRVGCGTPVRLRPTPCPQVTLDAASVVSCRTTHLTFFAAAYEFAGAAGVGVDLFAPCVSCVVATFWALFAALAALGALLDWGGRSPWLRRARALLLAGPAPSRSPAAAFAALALPDALASRALALLRDEHFWIRLPFQPHLRRQAFQSACLVHSYLLGSALLALLCVTALPGAAHAWAAAALLDAAVLFPVLHVLGFAFAHTRRTRGGAGGGGGYAVVDLRGHAAPPLHRDAGRISGRDAAASARDPDLDDLIAPPKSSLALSNGRRAPSTDTSEDPFRLPDAPGGPAQGPADAGAPGSNPRVLRPRGSRGSTTPPRSLGNAILCPRQGSANAYEEPDLPPNLRAPHRSSSRSHERSTGTPPPKSLGTPPLTPPLSPALGPPLPRTPQSPRSTGATTPPLPLLLADATDAAPRVATLAPRPDQPERPETLRARRPGGTPPRGSPGSGGDGAAMRDGWLQEQAARGSVVTPIPSPPRLDSGASGVGVPEAARVRRASLLMPPRQESFQEAWEGTLGTAVGSDVSLANSVWDKLAATEVRLPGLSFRTRPQNPPGAQHSRATILAIG